MKGTGLERFNSQHHWYIDHVSCDNIYVVIISGTAGIMRYMDYSWRDAVRRYNAMAKEKETKRAALYGY